MSKEVMISIIVFWIILMVLYLLMWVIGKLLSWAERPFKDLKRYKELTHENCKRLWDIEHGTVYCKAYKQKYFGYDVFYPREYCKLKPGHKGEHKFN